jgi:glucosyl-3-phosphoglycerate synthase
MERPPRTVAIIPARNEAATLAETLKAAREIPGVSHIIVVDNGSTDNTAKIAAEMGVEVIRASNELGKGGAILAGISHARTFFPEAFLLADGDLGSSAAELEALVFALGDETPATIAAFPKSVASGGGFGLVKNFARREIHRRTGFSPVEPLSGQRALLVAAVEKLPGVAPGFGAEVGMTLDLLGGGIRPVEIPVNLSHRPTGKSLSGFVHRARQGIDVVKALRGERLEWK